MTEANIWQPSTKVAIDANDTLAQEAFKATANQRVFVLESFEYTVGLNTLLVFKNGALLSSANAQYSEVSSTTFTLSEDEACDADDVVLALGFTAITAEASDMLSSINDAVEQAAASANFAGIWSGTSVAGNSYYYEDALWMALTSSSVTPTNDEVNWISLYDKVSQLALLYNTTADDFGNYARTTTYTGEHYVYYSTTGMTYYNEDGITGTVTSTSVGVNGTITIVTDEGTFTAASLTYGSIVSRTSDVIELVDGTSTYTIPDMNAETSEVYVFGDNIVTQRLIKHVHFTYSTDDLETITLTDSYSGGKLIAFTNTQKGSQLIRSSMTKATLIAATNLNDGDYVTITDLDNAPFIISASSTTSKDGDITMDSGQIAVLQASEMGFYKVTWFGAVAEETATTDQVAYFNLAAARTVAEANGTGRQPPVLVPTGNFKVGSAVTDSAIWWLMPGGDPEGLGGVAPSSAIDCSYLTGRVISWNTGYLQSRGLVVGDNTWAAQKVSGKAFSGQVMGVGDSNGPNGIAGISITGDPDTNDLVNNNVHACQLSVVNNASSYAKAWGQYIEAIKGEDATGPTWCTEMTMMNYKDETVQLSPNGQGDGTGGTFILALNSGGDSDDDTTYVTSCVMLIYGKNGGSFNRGIVFQDTDTCIDTKEAVVMPGQYELCWYDLNSSDTEIKAAYVKGNVPSDAGQLSFGVYNDSETEYQFTLTSGNFSPVVGITDTVAIGTDTRRWIGIYLVNSPNTSSDINLKLLRGESIDTVDRTSDDYLSSTSNGELTSAEKTAALAIARLPRIFQWISEINSKSSDSDATVYLHCSPIAQAVWSAMEDAGLDPTKYGFISNGADSDGDCYYLQPQELLWLICAAQQEKIDDFETRISALEG